MSKLKPVVTSRSLELGDYFDDVVNNIKSDSSLECLYKSYPKEKRIEYFTESIHPNHSEHPDRIPILFLFSNPHPDSVRRGLFLSEPHSQAFWERLFESDYFHMPPDGEINLESWDMQTPELLGRLMLKGEYCSPFLLYFHCLWPLPTKQVADLKKLFASTPTLWERLNRDGVEELVKLTKCEQIGHIVVFTGQIFQLITGAKNADYKGRRDKIKGAVIDYLKDNKTESYWDRLSFCHAKATFSNDVDVYLSLDTRSKNLKIKGMKKRYFTFAIDMILKRVTEINRTEIK